MSYLEFYGFAQEPFSNAPVSRFYYESQQHQRALMRLQYAVSGMKGLAVLVGSIGAGKTTLARRLLDTLDESEYEAALLVIIHSGVTSQWLLRRIALQLGVEGPSDDKLTLLSQLYRRLVEIYEAGKKAVVLIDEAQMLQSRELMEEFRGLLNIEVPERKLLSFVFFGLPEIEQHLMYDPPLAQRVALRVRLDPFDLAATQTYIEHRLRVAGLQHSPIDHAAYPLIHRASGGLPRLINTVCDNALFEGALAGAPVVGVDLVRNVARNLSLPTDESPQQLARRLQPRRAPNDDLPSLRPEAAQQHVAHAPQQHVAHAPQQHVAHAHVAAQPAAQGGAPVAQAIPGAPAIPVAGPVLGAMPAPPAATSNINLALDEIDRVLASLGKAPPAG